MGSIMVTRQKRYLTDDPLGDFLPLSSMRKALLGLPHFSPENRYLLVSDVHMLVHWAYHLGWTYFAGLFDLLLKEARDTCHLAHEGVWLRVAAILASRNTFRVPYKR